jgi:hypothetical protein
MLPYLGHFFLYRFSPPTTASWVMVWPMTFATTVVAGCLFAWAASRFLFEARRAGELELLLTTPLGAKTIGSEQWNVLRRTLRWPISVMLTAFLFPVALTWFQMWSSWSGSSWSSSPMLILLYPLLNAVNTVLGVVALCWLGMWFGFKSRTQTGAIIMSVLWAKAAPWLFSVCCSFLPLILVVFGLRANAFLALAPPQILETVFYLWLIKRVRQRLLGELRDAEPASLISNLATMRHSWKNRVSAFHRVRHWTPT